MDYPLQKKALKTLATNEVQGFSLCVQNRE